MNVTTKQFLLSFCLTALLSAQSCRSSTDSPIPVNSAGTCLQTLEVIGTLDQAKGKVVGSVEYAIVLPSPVTVAGRSFSNLTSYNLPDNLKKAGQPVIISGRVLSYGKDVETRMDIFGQPFEIMTIRSAK